MGYFFLLQGSTNAEFAKLCGWVSIFRITLSYHEMMVKSNQRFMIFIVGLAKNGNYLRCP